MKRSAFVGMDGNGNVSPVNFCGRYAEKGAISMKKHRTWLACAMVLALSAGMTGCTNISSSDTTQVTMDAQTTEPTTLSVEESSQETQTETTQNENDTENSEAKSTTDSAEKNADDTSGSTSETIGDTGMTADEWVAEAQNIYTTAASTYFTYLCSSGGFDYDMDDVVDGNWFHVTNCDTLEEAGAEFYSVFSEAAHESDLDGQLQLIDDKVYRLCGDRGADISYVSSKVTALTDSTADTLTFSVTSTYQYPEEDEITTKDDVFTLVFERGVWRVGQFTMPY